MGTMAPGSGPPSTNFRALPPVWQNLATKIILIGVDGSYWDLAGNYAGRQGITMAPHVTGLMHVPFRSIFSEGPYQIGAVYERTDYLRRTISFGAQVGIDYGPDTSSWRYRMLEQRWWRAWSATADSTMCVYTRTHGWRFIKVRLAEDPKNAFEIDPVAFDNNFMQWDLVVVALQPYWNKKMMAPITLGATVVNSGATWKNNSSTSLAWTVIEELLQNGINQFLGDVLVGAGGTLVPGKDIGSGVLTAWNNGDQAAWPKFQVSSPGRAWIQDGIGGRMIPLPLLSDTDGTCLVDTDPNARTLTCATDPVDPLLFQILRNSQLLDILLNDLLASTEPVWKRFQYAFTTPVPPLTLANLKVYHSDPTGTVTLMMPQQYDKAYG